MSVFDAPVEFYILDSLYRRNILVDDYISLIWTERYSASGDLQLKVQSTLQNRSRYKTGVLFGLNHSARVMIAIQVETDTDSDNNQTMTITGASLESIMSSRLALGALADTTSTPYWTITDTPANIATKMFKNICIDGLLDGGDIIPGVTLGSIFPADTVPPYPDAVTYQIDPQTLYDAEVSVCNQYLLGFRLVRNADTSQLYFDVYSGSDRTTHQTMLPAVVFAPELENLTSMSSITSSATYKNVAYVISPVGATIVYAPGIDPSVDGFTRRILLVNATDITSTDPPTALAQMIAEGLAQLAVNRNTIAYDGEISQTSSYIYGRDYNLGDLVELRDEDGFSNTMQVTEQIFSVDNTGYKSYPTLVINEQVTPGSWLALPPGKVWSDYGSDDYWEDQ